MDPFGGLPLIRRLANQQSVAIQDEVDSFVEGGYGNSPWSGQGGRKLAMLSRSVALPASLTWKASLLQPRVTSSARPAKRS